MEAFCLCLAGIFKDVCIRLKQPTFFNMTGIQEDLEGYKEVFGLQGKIVFFQSLRYQFSALDKEIGIIAYCH